MKTIEAFCANDQERTDHNLEVDNNGEVTLTCDCGRFWKLPAGLDKQAFEELLAIHEASNKLSEEQLAVEENRKASQELIESL